MGFCNSVNLCSHAVRHFSLQPKHIGYTAEGFSSNVWTAAFLTPAKSMVFFLPAAVVTDKIVLLRQLKGSRFLQPDDYDSKTRVRL